MLLPKQSPPVVRKTNVETKVKPKAVKPQHRRAAVTRTRTRSGVSSGKASTTPDRRASVPQSPQAFIFPGGDVRDLSFQSLFIQGGGQCLSRNKHRQSSALAGRAGGQHQVVSGRVKKSSSDKVEWHCKKFNVPVDTDGMRWTVEQTLLVSISPETVGLDANRVSRAGPRVARRLRRHPESTTAAPPSPACETVRGPRSRPRTGQKKPRLDLRRGFCVFG